MIPIEIAIDRTGPILRAAIVQNGTLTDLHTDHAGRPSRLGAIFLGRVERLVPALDGAYVNIGTDRHGLLNAADVRPGLERAGPGKGARIGTLLRAGQTVLVQVKADAVGEKGPTLTMDLTFPGRFLVHAPFGKGIAVSKRLAQGAARADLIRRVGEAVLGEGWIVRGGASGTATLLLVAEAESLALAWRGVQQGAAQATAPALLRPGLDAARRAIVEQGGRPIARIAVADASLADALGTWCGQAAPDLLARLERAKPDLFDTHDLEGQIAQLLKARVPLRGGGSLMIERTEALTVVDVNAAERGNALQVNLEAATEIARQLRLRNIGGIIVVDFINMAGRGDAECLIGALTAAVADDPVQTQVYGMSRLGLIEMTRARRGPPLADLLAAEANAKGDDTQS